MVVKVKFKKLVDDAVIPEYKSPGAACFDLATIESQVVRPGESRSFRTGLAFELPSNFELQIRPRSGMSFTTGLIFKNTIGTIDSDYRGEIRICLHNLDKEPIEVKAGSRIAQGKISHVPTVEMIETEEMSTTERGENGFGSTGS